MSRESIPTGESQSKPTLEQLKNRILTSEQYLDHPYAQIEDAGEYVFEVTQGQKHLAFFGALHTNDFSNPIFTKIKDYFEKNKPQKVYVEGISPRYFNTEGSREHLQELSPAEAAQNGENVYTLKLAVDAGVLVESPEPPFSEEVRYVLSQGFSKKDIFSFYAYRNIDQFVREHADPTAANAAEVILRTVQEFQQVDGFTVPELQSYQDEIQAGLNLSNPEFYTERADPIPWKGKAQFATNGVSRDSSNFRDRYIFDRIAEGLKTQDNLLVVYGSAHAVKLEAALRSLVEQGVANRA